MTHAAPGGQPRWTSDVPGLHIETGHESETVRVLGWPGIVPLSVLRAMAPAGAIVP